MSDRPTGVLTFLFTDIQGSTSRWEEHEEKMRAALARHDQVLRSTIERHDGWVCKHTGDGVLAVFSSPGEAARAAIEAQRALDLPVRMGLATGEAELRDDDYFGPTLNRAARVMAAGHGGQVLVASSTAVLLDGFDLVDLGEHRLKDLPRAQRLFQLCAEGLEKSFPPLRTAAAPGNLPLQSTSFVGRERDVAEVIEALRHSRVVTLTGVGGVGKTRLALQVAAELAAKYQGGAWLVELAPVGDAGAAAHVIAATVGVSPNPERRSWRACSKGSADGRRCWYSTTASISSTPSPTSRNTSCDGAPGSPSWRPAAKRCGSRANKLGPCRASTSGEGSRGPRFGCSTSALERSCHPSSSPPTSKR